MANELVGPVHVRMPVILPPGNHEALLGPSGQDVKRLQSLLRPYPSEEMEAHPVSTLVNILANDTPACIAPLA